MEVHITRVRGTYFSVDVPHQFPRGIRRGDMFTYGGKRYRVLNVTSGYNGRLWHNLATQEL